jgi:CMP-N,N'-diacetyllegionaminic acid synthase
MKILYIIPARGGSKGLPGKNIRLLNAKPLIAHSILAAQRAQNKGIIVVSTDDTDIANIAKQYGAEVPFMRPAELSNDSASSIDVLLHAIEFYENKKQFFDLIVLLQPTSPLRTSEDIDNAIQTMKVKKAEAVVSVCETEHHPLWANIIPPDGSMKSFLRDDIKGLNRQQLPTYYRINGAVFISTIKAFKKNRSFIHDNTFSYVMPQSRSVDIDYEIDFKLAELLSQTA